MENFELNDYLKGKELFRIGEYEKSLKIFEEIIQNNPDNVKYLYASASANHFIGNIETSLYYYEKILEKDPNHIKSLMGKINCLENLDKADEALKLIQSFLNENNNDLIAARRAITLLYLKKNKEEVYSCFNDIKTDNQAYIYYLKYIVSSAFLDWENVKQNIDYALKYSSFSETILDEGTYISKKDIYLSKLDFLFEFDEEFDKALEVCEILLKEYPKDLEVLYKKARIYSYIDFETSLNIINFALHYNPDDIDLLNLKASIYSSLGNDKTALMIYDKINQIDSKYEYSWGNMARIYYFNKEYNKAFNHAQKAVEINPDFGFAIYYGSRALKKLGKKQLFLEWEKKLNNPNVDSIYLEKNLQEILVNDPWHFESIGLNLEFKEREFTLKDRSGRLDILYEDTDNGDYIVVELKIHRANSAAYYQIAEYVDSIKKTIGRNKNVKGIIVSFGQSENCEKLVDEDPRIMQVDYKKLGLE